jgi:hypothetical protein
MNSRGQKNLVTPIWPILIILIILTAGGAIYSWAYNSPMFAETVCRDAHQTFGIETRVAIDQLSNGHCQVKIDNNWIDICDSNIGNYCTASN